MDCRASFSGLVFPLPDVLVEKRIAHHNLAQMVHGAELQSYCVKILAFFSCSSVVAFFYQHAWALYNTQQHGVLWGSLSTLISDGIAHPLQFIMQVVPVSSCTLSESNAGLLTLLMVNARKRIVLGISSHPSGCNIVKLVTCCALACLWGFTQNFVLKADSGIAKGVVGRVWKPPSSSYSCSL